MLKGKKLQAITGKGSNAAEHDFYASDPATIDELLAREGFKGPILEPAAGNGAMSKRLEGLGYSVVSRDLVDRGFGASGIDFLMTKGEEWDSIITNPPFRLSDKFLEHSLSLVRQKRGKVAFLNKLNWLAGVKRKTLFQNSPLKSIYVFSREPTFYKNGTTPVPAHLIEFAWFVWDFEFSGKPSVGWI